VPDAKGGAANMNVLLVAAKRSQIDDHLDLVSASGLMPEVIDVDPFALGNAWALATGVERRMEEAEKAMAFVDIGARKTTINIVRGDVSLFTREIYFGGMDFTAAIARTLNVESAEAEAMKRGSGDAADPMKEAVFPALDELGSEIQLSFDYFANTFEKTVDAIYLSGGGAKLAPLREGFERIFEKPTAIFNPFQSLKIDSGVDGAMLINNAPQLVVAVGLASRLRKE
jgi:type IV pilus assembly protein PilM